MMRMPLTPPLDHSLLEAVTITFQQVVFLLGDLPPDEEQRKRRVRAVANVAFSGPAEGVLQVRACEGLLPRLTASMLGEAAGNEVMQLDALGEIANIICGQIFPRLDRDQAFTQMPPVVSTDGESSDAGWPPAAASVEIGLENSRADVRLYLFTHAA